MKISSKHNVFANMALHQSNYSISFSANQVAIFLLIANHITSSYSQPNKSLRKFGRFEFMWKPPLKSIFVMIRIALLREIVTFLSGKVYFSGK